MVKQTQNIVAFINGRMKKEKVYVYSDGDGPDQHFGKNHPNVRYQAEREVQQKSGIGHGSAKDEKRPSKDGDGKPSGNSVFQRKKKEIRTVNIVKMGSKFIGKSKYIYFLSSLL